jgi:AhpD family alkylhydroperoxidase
MPPRRPDSLISSATQAKRARSAEAETGREEADERTGQDGADELDEVLRERGRVDLIALRLAALRCGWCAVLHRPGRKRGVRDAASRT